MNRKNLILFLILSMVIWGGSWTSGKLLSVDAPVEVIIFWRFFLTTLSMIPLVFLFKTGFRVRPAELILLILGGGIIYLYNIGFFTGLQNGYAGAGGVLVTGLNPVFTFLLTLIVGRERASVKQTAALIIGFAGGLIMLEIWNSTSDQILDGGNSFFLLASASWAVLTLLSHRIQKKVHFILYGFYIYLFCSLFALASSLIQGTMAQTPNVVPFWLNMGYMSIGATTIATTVYFLCTRELGSRRASSFIFTVPVSALLFSWLILGEIPTMSTLAGGALTIAAVYLINSGKS